jgi:tetratricopeptide (TPR) repeat protein
VHLRTADALGMKQSIEQVQRMVKSVPSLALILERARGAYMLLRRHYTEAIPVLERCLQEPPAAVIGWARAHGALARALNGLALHERARDTCLRAIRALSPEDLRFPAMNLGVQIELALAYAGLGQHDLAIKDLDALLAEHTPNNGPLTLGALHEARARVAMWMGDEATCRTHLAAMEKFFRGTDVPSLIARSESFAKEVKRHYAGAREPDSMTLDGSYVAPTSTSSVSTSTGITLVERELTQATSLPDFAQRALRVLTDGMHEPRAALWVLNGEQLDLQASSGAGELPRELSEWVQERCAAAQADDVTQTAIVDDIAAGDPDVLVSQGYTYRLCFLRGGYADQEISGVLVTGSTDAATGAPSTYVLEAIGKKLKQQLKTLHTSIGTLH